MIIDRTHLAGLELASKLVSEAIHWQDVTEGLAKLIAQTQAAPGAESVAAVIGFYDNEREPRLLSWNVLPPGEHRLFTAPQHDAELVELLRKLIADSAARGNTYTETLNRIDAKLATLSAKP